MDASLDKFLYRSFLILGLYMALRQLAKEW
jgi:hypothetical protein